MEKTPERKAAERTVTAGYERWLRLYALAKRLPRQCWGMWAIEGSIVGAVERGIGVGDEDKDLTLGIAIVRANVGIGGFDLAVTADGAYSREEAQQVMYDLKAEEIERAARWLTRLFRRGRLRLRSKRPRHEYEERLWELDQLWDQMPITNPLPAP